MNQQQNGVSCREKIKDFFTPWQTCKVRGRKFKVKELSDGQYLVLNESGVKVKMTGEAFLEFLEGY